MSKIIIFTDLDGSLLHPKTYSFEEARYALKLIKDRGIPLVLCSSKTRAEMEVYRERLYNSYPFISENGGGIFIPKGYFSFDVGAWHAMPLQGYEAIILGKPYEEIRNYFIELRQRLNSKAKGFGDMTAREIATLASLTEEEATLAKQRDFGDPFIFEGDTDEIFLNAIEEKGLHWTQGRFFQIMGNNNKGKAVRILKRLYAKEFGEIMTIGLGDGFNDLPMLKEVDYPVLIQKEDGSYEPRINLQDVMRAQGTGPAGWNKAVINILKKSGGIVDGSYI